MKTRIFVAVLAVLLLASLVPLSYAQAPKESFTCGVNYLSYGNRYADTTDDVLERDFALFEENNIHFISMRVMWSAVEDQSRSTLTSHVYRSEVIANYIRVLDAAERHNIRVNVDFWTHFHSFSTYWRPSYVQSNRDIYLDSTTKQAWFDMVTYVVLELTDHAAVYSWTVLNEPFYDVSSDMQPIEDLINEEAQLIGSLTEKGGNLEPNQQISCRFTIDYNPWHNRFSFGVLANLDFVTLTEYLNPDPNSEYHGATWDTINSAVDWCEDNGKEFWIIEFGDNNPSPEVQRLHYEDSIEMFYERGIDVCFAWAWQSVSPNSESYNIAYGVAEPKPAFYELAFVAKPHVSTGSFPVTTLAVIVVIGGSLALLSLAQGRKK